MTIGDFKREPRRRKVPRGPQETRDGGGAAKRRRRPRGRLWLILLLAVGLAVAAAPGLVCHTFLGHHLFAKTAAKYGIEGSFQTLRVGWVTPLRVTRVEVVGQEAGSRLRLEQVDCSTTLLKMVTGSREPVAIMARGVVIDGVVGDGWSSLERDFEALQALQADEAADARSHGKSSTWWEPSELVIDVQNITIKLTDAVDGRVGGLDHGKAEVKIVGGAMQGGLSAVLSDASASSGELDLAWTYDGVVAPRATLDAKCQGLPLRLASLARRRFSDWADSIPEQLSGDMTGSFQVDGQPMPGSDSWTWAVEARPLDIRNLVASGPAMGTNVWRNGLVTVRGRAEVAPNAIRGEQLRLATDFADVSFNGVIVPPDTPTQVANPLAWLMALEGAAAGFVNLPVMVDRLPGVLPLKPDTELVTGVIHAEITSVPDTNGNRVVSANLNSDPLHARAAGRNLTLEPASLVAAIRVDTAGQWRADECQLSSVFGTASLIGELADGRATADIDLGRLAATLEPLVDLSELQLAGVAAGQLRWSAQADDRWRLRGDANAKNLMISLPSGVHLHRPSLEIQVDAAGRWKAGELQELTAAEMTLQSESIEIDTTLAASVPTPGADTLWPLRFRGVGRMEVLSQFLGPWLPEPLHSVSGGFTGQAEAVVGLAAGEVNAVNLRLEEPRVGWDQRLFAQSEMAVDFRGQYAWSLGSLAIESLTVTGQSISAAAKGMANDQAVDLEIAFRADLDRLQGTVLPGLTHGNTIIGQAKPASTVVANKSASTRSGAANQPTGPWQYQGGCEGSIRMTRQANEGDLSIETHVQATDFVIRQPRSPHDGRLPSGAGSGAIVWAEPHVRVDGSVIYRGADGAVDTQHLALATDWIATKLTGRVLYNDEQCDIQLQGPASIKMGAVAGQLSTLVGTPIVLQGIHETPVDMVAKRRPDGSTAVNVTANLGWEAGEVAGVAFGPSAIPVHMTETTVSIRDAVVPVDQGRITASADIHYSPGPLWMDVQPGVIAQNLRITPELSDRWLQYLAPMVAQATRVDGTFGVELMEAAVHLEDPLQSRVRGQLQINQVNFDAGPVTNQLLSSVQQIQMIARGRAAAEAAPQDRNRNLAALPTQSVDFTFTDGIITHQRMFMLVDRARIITSGQVHVDGNLNLVAQVPLEAEWLGSHLKSLAGQTITMPISGTLGRPRLDPTAIRNLVTQMGTKALQSEAENYLEKQLNRGLERLLGK